MSVKVENRDEKRGKLTSTGDGLTVALVLDVTGSEDTLDARQGRSGLCLDVAVLVHVELSLDQVGGGVVADGVEEPVGLDGLLLAGLDVLDDEVAHEAVLAALDLLGHGVEPDGGLLVVEEPVGHGPAGAELVAADEDGDVAGVLCQERGLLGGRVAAADDVEGLVAEDGHGAVADGAGGDAVLPVGLLALEVHAAGGGAGGDDDGVGRVGFVRVELGGVLEGALAEVEGGDGVGDDLGAEAFGLGAHVVLHGEVSA